MVDLEYEIYTALATAMRAEIEDISLGTVTEYAPPSFPHLSVVEADNYSYRASRDTASNDNHAVVMYELTAFSNKQNTKKQECKKIMAVADAVMDSLGFTRMGLTPAIINDGSVMRMVARYEAVVSPTGIIYRR